MNTNKIFVLSDDKDADSDSFFTPWMGYLQMLSFSGKYLKQNDNKEFLKAIKLLEKTYGIKVSWGNKRPYLSPETLKTLKTNIVNIIKKRAKQIKTLITKAEKGKRPYNFTLVYDITHKAWIEPRIRFLIGKEIYNSFELLNGLKKYRHKPLWIVATYTYYPLPEDSLNRKVSS